MCASFGSYTQYHAPARKATEPGQSYQFRHIFSTWGFSHCFQWGNWRPPSGSTYFIVGISFRGTRYQQFLCEACGLRVAGIMVFIRPAVRHMEDRFPLSTGFHPRRNSLHSLVLIIPAGIHIPPDSIHIDAIPGVVVAAMSDTGDPGLSAVDQKPWVLDRLALLSFSFACCIICLNMCGSENTAR